ncbi:MAG: hypothetical protein QMB52_06380, partial [Propionivibrio sp.]
GGRSEPKNDAAPIAIGNNCSMIMVRIRLALSLLVSVIAHILLFSLPLVGLQAVSAGKATLLSARLLSASRDGVYVEERTATSLASDAHSPYYGPARASASNSLVAGGLKAEDRSPFPLVALEDYLPASVLTSPPSPIDSIDPTPAGVSLNGVLGEVVLLLLISSEGDVDAIVTESSTLPQFFVDFAKNAFSSTRFTPGLVNSTAVRSRLRIVLSPTPSHVDPETGNPLSAKNRRR